MGREFELKFSATPEILSAVEKKYGDFRQIRMETTYYDTADRALAARHITLRRRMENGLSVCTVKTPLSDGSKGEWELQWQDPDSMVEELCKLGGPQMLLSLTAGGIEPVCGARFTRRAKTLTFPDGSVELALDTGVLLGGGREMPLCELEVELKTGPDGVAMAFAAEIADEFGLQPEHRSKVARAQQLEKGE